MGGGGMAADGGSWVVVVTMVVLVAWAVGGSAQQSYTPVWAVTDWAQAHATFYGGQDASGTMGGACGYGNLYSFGYGTNTAALSNALFNNGLSCGACFQLQCILSQSNWCYPGASLTVTATNNCPQGSFGGWCDYPNAHFDLAYPAFTQLAQAVGGVIPVLYRRVACSKQGGIRFTIQGNPYFDSVLVTNVGGGGDVQSVAVQGGSSGFSPMAHSWGQFWSSGTDLVGQPLSFLVTLGNGVTQQFWNVADNGWSFGATYEANSNF